MLEFSDTYPLNNMEKLDVFSWNCERVSIVINREVSIGEK